MSTNWLGRALGWASAVVIAVTGVVAPLTPPPASAAPAGVPGVSGLAAAPDPGTFSPGNIISDAVFYNDSTLAPADIQAFFVQQVPVCSSGYTCLKDYRENTATRPADAYCARPFDGGTAQSAAEIVYRAAKACGINPQVLIVLLQKEQGLVTKTAPTTGAYLRATGYGCPDTAPCNAEYFGFANQVWRAARQYQIYRKSPWSFNHHAGQVNQIRFHPNAACGTSPVFIENQATAGLYNYTPYQPNGAALANLYGTGDGCSSYGNRNFWRLFNDWFGSPHGGSLVRTAGDATIYLLGADDTKYPVRSVQVFSALSGALGPHQLVSQSYLDQLTTGRDAGLLLREPRSGSIYLAAYGQKNQFTSCATVAQWGFGPACGPYVDILPSALVRFSTGAPITQFAVSSSTNVIYWVTGGEKRTIHEWAQVVRIAGGGSTAYARFPQVTLNLLPTGADVLDPLDVVRTAGNPTLYLASSDQDLIRIDAGYLLSLFGLPAHIVVNDATITKLTVAASPLGLAVVCDGAEHLAGGGMIWRLPRASGLPAHTLGDQACDTLQTSPNAVTGGIFLRLPTTGAIYFIEGGQKLAMTSMAEVNARNSGQPLVLIPTSAAALAAIPNYTPQLTPATLVKAAGDPRVYLVDGAGSKVGVGSFAVAAEFGITGYATVPASALASRTTGAHPLGLVVQCGADPFVAGGGMLWDVPSTAGFATATLLDPQTCSLLQVSPQAVTGEVFARNPQTGEIFHLAGGTKHHMSSMSVVNSINGSAPLVLIPIGGAALATLPTGAPDS